MTLSAPRTPKVRTRSNTKINEASSNHSKSLVNKKEKMINVPAKRKIGASYQNTIKKASIKKSKESKSEDLETNMEDYKTTKTMAITTEEKNLQNLKPTTELTHLQSNEDTNNATATIPAKITAKNESNNNSPTRKRKKNNIRFIPMPILNPGEQFITPFGIVQVVKDNRAPPDLTKIPLSKLDKKKQNVLSRQKEKYAYAFKRAYVSNYDKLRAARRVNKKIYNKLYKYSEEKTKSDMKQQNSHKTLNDQDTISKRIFYLDNRPTLAVVSPAPCNSQGQFVKRTSANSQVQIVQDLKFPEKIKGDPRVPPKSYPDRIVECIPIRDERTIFVIDETKTDVESFHLSSSSICTMRLFIRRRMLIEKYISKASLYACKICGDRFKIKNTLIKHVQNQKCLNKPIVRPLWRPLPAKIRTYPKRCKEVEQLRRIKKRKRLQEEAKKRADELEEMYKDYITTKKSTQHQNLISTSNLKESAVYPEVWKELDFNKIMDIKKKPKKNRPPWVSFQKEYTAVYPNVYRSLKFIANPSKTKKSYEYKPRTAAVPQQQSNPITVKKKRRTPLELKRFKIQLQIEKEKEREKERKLAQSKVVDMMVLVEEIDTGRYPSIKRYEGEHTDVCIMCKKGTGIIYCCGFCENACHLECMRDKVTLRNPEPEDDFMCYHCIKKILSRRARAEKRRLMKRDDVFCKNGINTIPVTTNPGDTVDSLNVDHATSSRAPIPSVESEITLPLPTLTAEERDTLHKELGVTRCPNGGPGGLVCCEVCGKQYSQALADVSNEMEIQTIAMVGREVSEMIELLKDAQLRATQALDLLLENENRRKLLGEDEI